MTRYKRLLLIIAALLSAAFAADHAQAQYQPVIRQGVCTFQYQPVCAVARKRTLVTYGNACDARNARARIVSDGACNDACPHIYKPVCTRDAKGARRTFANACTAKAAKAAVIHRGRCLLPAR
jgi:hypothetical protein